jgi:hypothetical protein
MALMSPFNMEEKSSALMHHAVKPPAMEETMYKASASAHMFKVRFLDKPDPAKSLLQIRLQTTELARFLASSSAGLLKNELGDIKRSLTTPLLFVFFTSSVALSFSSGEALARKNIPSDVRGQDAGNKIEARAATKLQHTFSEETNIQKRAD